jgi:ATP adenylyltransferase/5',5'''-P-1,P-4-tetraphosphate phosphorylase II
MEKVNLTKMFFILIIISKHNYEQLFEVYNGGHCAMVLIKNVTTITTKED